MAKGKFRLRARVWGKAYHYEGPFGPIDIEVVEEVEEVKEVSRWRRYLLGSSPEISQRRFTLSGPGIGTGELTLPGHMTPEAGTDLMRAGITVRIGGTAVQLSQHENRWRRSRRTVAVERPDRPPALLRLRRGDSMSLERPGGTRLARMGWRRGRVWDTADATDVAILILADTARLRNAISRGWPLI